MAPVAITPSNTLPSNEADIGAYRGYDHVTWYVGNAKQAASFYITRFGFKHIAYRGLETGSRYIASHVVSNGAVRFVLTSPIRTPDLQDGKVSHEEQELLHEIYAHLEQHGDAVKDVAFQVDNVRALFNKAVQNGAIAVQSPRIVQDSKEGKVLTAVVKTYGDTTHTFIQRNSYTGVFMPGYRATQIEDPIAAFLPNVPLEAIDHCVGNQDWDQMDAICD
jgi:4-hydroxyphenylpyruvate dioxygenase